MTGPGEGTISTTGAATGDPRTRALVIHPDIRTGTESKSATRSAETLLVEAVSLAEALDLDVVEAVIAPLQQPRAGWLFGSGKVEELGEAVAASGAELVVVNGPISPRQQQNLEKAWKIKLIDRTGLILEIFGERAQTREGALQVELAHLQYQRSRLVRSWTHLERQRGGLGFVGGPGETQIEADRRALDERMIRIRRQLEKTVRTRGLQRSARQRVPYPVVALVGYTNAGKSTLFNRLTGAKVMAKDMLFATLDPTMRGVELAGGRKVILSDTVGFIADLPTQLIAAFRATLEEVLEADLIIHVRDASHADAEAQDHDVRETLATLGVDEAAQGEIVTLHNKLDLMNESARAALIAQCARRAGEIAGSAVTGAGLDELTDEIGARLGASEVVRHLRLDHAEGEALAWLYRHCEVLERHDHEDGVDIRVTARPSVFEKLAQVHAGAGIIDI